MNYLLIGIIAVLFLYLLYQDIANRKERHRLQVLIKSETATEFKEAVTKPQKPEPTKPPEPSPYVPLEDVPVETLITNNPKEKL